MDLDTRDESYYGENNKAVETASGDGEDKFENTTRETLPAQRQTGTN
jgi:hypothetical protein